MNFNGRKKKINGGFKPSEPVSVLGLSLNLLSAYDPVKRNSGHRLHQVIEGELMQLLLNDALVQIRH